MTLAYGEATAGQSIGRAVGSSALKTAAVIWFFAAVIGQWIFAVYILGHYGASSAIGNFEPLLKRFHNGDTAGNAMLAVHLAFAFIVTVGGPLQLVPQIRTHAPRFHHWNGRLFLLTTVAASAAGLYMVWTRGVPGGFSNHFAFTLNALLVFYFAALTVRYAMARDIDTHRRWALRLFMAANGVWFFRVGLMAWFIVNHGPLGNTKTLDGPFDVIWAYGCYLLPLAVLELYLRARDRAGPFGKIAAAGVVVGFAGLMGLGIFGAASFMWLPRMAPWAL